MRSFTAYAFVKSVQFLMFFIGSTDEDFEMALMIANVYLQHGLLMYNNLPKKEDFLLPFSPISILILRLKLSSISLIPLKFLMERLDKYIY